MNASSTAAKTRDMGHALRRASRSSLACCRSAACLAAASRFCSAAKSVSASTCSNCTLPKPRACFFCSSKSLALCSRALRSAARACASAARANSASRRATYSRARVFTSAIRAATPTFAVACVVLVTRRGSRESAMFVSNASSEETGGPEVFSTSSSSRGEDTSSSSFGASFERPAVAFACSAASRSASRSLCPYVFSPSFGASARVYRRTASSRTASSDASSSAENDDEDPLRAVPVFARAFAADAASSPPPLAWASDGRGTASGAFACVVPALVMAPHRSGRRARRRANPIAQESRFGTPESARFRKDAR